MMLDSSCRHSHNQAFNKTVVDRSSVKKGITKDLSPFYFFKPSLSILSFFPANQKLGYVFKVITKLMKMGTWGESKM